MVISRYRISYIIHFLSQFRSCCIVTTVPTPEERNCVTSPGTASIFHIARVKSFAQAAASMSYNAVVFFKYTGMEMWDTCLTKITHKNGTQKDTEQHTWDFIQVNGVSWVLHFPSNGSTVSSCITPIQQVPIIKSFSCNSSGYINPMGEVHPSTSAWYAMTQVKPLWCITSSAVIRNPMQFIVYHPGRL